MPLKSSSKASVEQCRIQLRDLVLECQQIFSSEKKSNMLLNSVFQRLDKVGYDKIFFKVAYLHAKVMETVILRNKEDYKNIKFASPEECLSYYIAKIFFDKMLLYQSLNYPRKISYVDPIVILPIQAFLKKDNDVKLKFEKTIKANDILYVEVSKTVSLQPNGDKNMENVESRVIGRVNLNDESQKEFVYHLNINAYMFKKLELERLGRPEFCASEVFKVTVLGKTKSTKLFVTTNIDALRVPASQKSSVNLGFVSPKKVPFDLNSFKISSNFQGYANYLRTQPAFYHPLNLKDEISSIGIDPYRIYSFLVLKDGMTVSPNKTAASLYDIAKVATHAESPAHLAKAKVFLEKDDFQNAIATFEDSLKCWPDNYQVYEMRGKMYYGMCKKKLRKGSFLKKAVNDFETALELNPSAQEPKKNLSEILVYVSKKLVKNKKYDEAKKLVEIAKKLFSGNDQTAALLHKINKKKVCVVIDEDLDLTTLQMRKKLIVKQLEKEITIVE